VGNQNYVTTSTLTTASGDIISQIPSLTNYITTSRLTTTSGDIITQIPSLDGYATQSWANSQYYTQLQISTISGNIVSQIPSLTNYVTSSTLNTVSGNIVAQIPSLTGYVTSAILTTVSGDIINQLPGDASAATKGKIQLAGQLGGTAASPTVVGITEVGAQALTISTITDGQTIKRSGTTISGTDVYDVITFNFDNGTSAITTGFKGVVYVPYTCTITTWTLVSVGAVPVSGSLIVDIWSDTYTNYPPTDADSITSAAPPTISGSTKGQSSTLTNWTTTIPAGNFLAFNVDSCTSISGALLALTVKR
jgi:hypothetical protein